MVKSIWFQGLWFLAVIGRDSTFFLLLLAVGATLVYSVKKEQINLAWLATLVLIGIVLDTFHGFIGLFLFPQSWIPAWLILLWVIFIWYAYQMKTILTRFPLPIVSMIGALGAAGSYFAGLKLGAVQWPYSDEMTFVVLTIEWFLLFALVIYSLKALDKRGKGHNQHETHHT
ncbi:zinc ABC transporter permease [Vibrio inusitatus NBRC 102082]|uniref:Zinc ABC transporter permease n=1 Tax=Vibrio inusitatus NBRC 102082 TaxID=1219070 RepID=A0A4Y3HT58_9VIBR|nr:zinc ABC transporter permease [Vibrio inusitatus NBRC 102082]